MKSIIRKVARLILSAVILSSFIACENDVMFEDIPEDPDAPRIVSLGFSLSLTLHEKSSTTKAEFHTYIKDGYTVVVSDGIYFNQTYENVNLEEPLEVEVTGDVFVSIHHPSFQKNTLDTLAYFGVDEFLVHIENDSVNYVDLDLVQGFILVTVEKNRNNKVKSVSISRQDAELDIVYYTGMAYAFVEVQTKRDGTFRGFNAIVLGEGIQYIIPTSKNAKNLVSNKLL